MRSEAEPTIGWPDPNPNESCAHLHDDGPRRKHSSGVRTVKERGGNQRDDRLAANLLGVALLVLRLIPIRRWHQAQGVGFGINLNGKARPLVCVQQLTH